MSLHFLHFQLVNILAGVSHSECLMIFQEEPSVASPVLLHKSVPALESPATSKEADQPSPVSVLEPAFGDDLSSCSECFESVSADLQGSWLFILYVSIQSLILW